MVIVKHAQVLNTTLLNIVMIALLIVKHVRRVKQIVQHVFQENTSKEINAYLV